MRPRAQTAENPPPKTVTTAGGDPTKKLRDTQKAAGHQDWPDRSWTGPEAQRQQVERHHRKDADASRRAAKVLRSLRRQPGQLECN